MIRYLMLAALKQRLKSLVDYLFSLLGYQLCLLSEVSSEGMELAKLEELMGRCIHTFLSNG